MGHGRVCMIAFLGMVWSEQSHPFFDAWGDGPFVSAAASHFTKTAASNFWPAFWALSAGHELLLELYQTKGKSVYEHQGDLGFDPLGLKPTDPKELKDLQTKELNNGRRCWHYGTRAGYGQEDILEHLMKTYRCGSANNFFMFHENVQCSMNAVLAVWAVHLSFAYHHLRCKETYLRWQILNIFKRGLAASSCFTTSHHSELGRVVSMKK